MTQNDLYSVEITGLKKKFGDFEAVKDISFKIKKGEIFGILGPNGAVNFRWSCLSLLPVDFELPSQHIV